MALTKINGDVIEANAIDSTHLASGAVSASSLSSITTDNVSEGSTNTYFTNTRARGSVSVTGGGLSYDSGTGVIQIASIPNASLANSSLTVNSNSVSLGGTVTLDTDDIGEGSTNLYFTNARAQGAISGGTGVTVSSGTISIGQDVATSSTPTFGNITTTGYIAGPATFTIDPAAVGDNTGTVVIAGNLQVDGTTTTINSTTMTVDDLNITLASGAANAAAANGAGITVDGASATITYDGTNDEWDFNKDINVTGTITASGNITGTLATAAQPNITSVGTLTALDITTSGGGKFQVTDWGSSAQIGVDTASKALRINGTDSLRFYTGTAGSQAERVRIDSSSGSFMVGTTSSRPAEFLHPDGFAVRGDVVGQIQNTVTNAVNAILNRDGTDGDLILFRKEGTAVGTINVSGVDFIIDSAQTDGALALQWDDGGTTRKLQGYQTAFRMNTANDAAVDLGASNARFKDFYLSGTASIGNLTIAGSQGSDGQLLTSTGSGIAWEDAPAGGPTFKTFGTDSIMIGDNATGTINAADNNTGLGVDVFEDLTSGDSNVAIGRSALKNLTTGSENVAVGIEALFTQTGGSGNTAVGRVALRANTANNNTAVGTVSLYSNTSGTSNAALGAYALQSNTTASNNTAVGYGALLANTASSNTAVGYNALANTTTATQVTALGYRAGEDSTANSSTFIGFLAGAETTTGSQNTFIGASTAESGVCTGTSNTAVGGNNFTGITTGSYNCVMGTHAMRNFQTGEGNVVLGYNAKRVHSSGDDAVVIGNHAGYNMTTGRTVVVGNEAFYTGTITDDSVFIGNQAGYNVTTGYTNVIIGDRAGDTNLTTGYANTMVGYKAGRSNGGFANAFFGSGAGSGNTGSYNTCVGAGSAVSGASNGGITIGYGTTSGAAGTYATLGYSSSKSWISLGATGWSGSSDERLKENIRPSEAGLSFINDLKPVNFDWRKRKDIDPELETHKSDSDERYEKDNPTGKIGFIAQDVKEALDNHPEVISHLWEEQEDGTQALTPNELIPMLVKAVQELSAKVEELQNG